LWLLPLPKGEVERSEGEGVLVDGKTLTLALSLRERG
jgi:hypothetical protein